MTKRIIQRARPRFVRERSLGRAECLPGGAAHRVNADPVYCRFLASEPRSASPPCWPGDRNPLRCQAARRHARKGHAGRRDSGTCWSRCRAHPIEEARRPCARHRRDWPIQGAQYGPARPVPLRAAATLRRLGIAPRLAKLGGFLLAGEAWLARGKEEVMRI
jgi:hypothetical protein